jgi:hypothetical protein
MLALLQLDIASGEGVSFERTPTPEIRQAPPGAGWLHHGGLRAWRNAEPAACRGRYGRPRRRVQLLPHSLPQRARGPRAPGSHEELGPEPNGLYTRWQELESTRGWA